MRDRVYFAAADGRLKVGTTTSDVAVRLKAISASLPAPLVLIGDIQGGLPLERAIQRHLEPYRLKGEWFRDCDDTRRVVRNLILVGPRAILYVGPIYSHPPRRAPVQRAKRTKEERAELYRTLLAMRWGDDYERRLAKHYDFSLDNVRYWLSGEPVIPQYVAACIAHVVINGIGENEDGGQP